MKVETWKQRNEKAKYYAHFDKRVSIHDVWRYISDADKVAHHGFYPFIHYIQSYAKFSKETRIKPKERELCYAAHIDRYIYSYYGFLLNEKYNEWVINEGISDSAVAYRTDLGKNNVHFAKTVIDFIRDHEACYIVVGDFTHFFDLIDHRYLKKQLCNLFGCNTLPPDYYAVFKNITKYSTWDLESLIQLNELENTRAGVNVLNQKVQVLTPEQFKAHKKTCIHSHTESFGIPQGSPISAILSNIYMLEFDKKLRCFADENLGLYMRYSDDFIVILPIHAERPFADQLKWIQTLIQDTDGLELQEEKTQLHLYDKGRLENVSINYLSRVKEGKNLLNYLGFTFDGKVVTIRDKTLSKYYYRMYRKAKNIVKCGGYTKKGNRISKKNLYTLYSQKGAHIGSGNFLTYVQRSENIFGKNEATTRGTKKHMQKLKKQLQKTPQR